jgi:hypothetical protein
VRAERWVQRVLALAFGTLAFSSLSIASSNGACAPPTIAFEGMPDRDTMAVAPGDRVSLVGEYWTPDCFDTGPTGTCERGPGDEQPMRGVDVDLLQQELLEVRVIQDATANEDLTSALTFTVPELERGRYRVLVHDRGAQGYPELFLTVDL